MGAREGIRPAYAQSQVRLMRTEYTRMNEPNASVRATRSRATRTRTRETKLAKTEECGARRRRSPETTRERRRQLVIVLPASKAAVSIIYAVLRSHRPRRTRRKRSTSYALAEVQDRDYNILYTAQAHRGIIMQPPGHPSGPTSPRPPSPRAASSRSPAPPSSAPARSARAAWRRRQRQRRQRALRPRPRRRRT
jgi:hypothetical protein